MPPHGVGLQSEQDLQTYAGNHRVMPCTIGLSRLNFQERHGCQLATKPNLPIVANLSESDCACALHLET